MLTSSVYFSFWLILVIWHIHSHCEHSGLAKKNLHINASIYILRTDSWDPPNFTAKNTHTVKKDEKNRDCTTATEAAVSVPFHQFFTVWISNYKITFERSNGKEKWEKRWDQKKVENEIKKVYFEIRELRGQRRSNRVGDGEKAALIVLFQFPCIFNVCIYLK